MTIDDEDVAGLRAAFAQDGEAVGNCPPPERIWQAAWGDLAAGPRRQVIDHLAACPACARDWRLARALGLEAADPVERAAGRHRSSARVWGLTAAAASLVVAAGLLLVLGRGPDGGPAFRGDGPAIASLLPEDRPLPREGLVLRWTPGPPAARDSLLLSTEELRLLAAPRDLPSAEYAVPAAVLADLPPATTLLWRVERQLADGRRDTSPTFRLRLE
jgi:hypothetical protein